MSRVALCLNSSFLGFFAHAGFLQGLTEIGVRPVAVSGASAGALVAGLFAAGVSAEEMRELFLSRDLSRVFREPAAPLRGLATFANLPGRTGALRGQRALGLLRQRLGGQLIETCPRARLGISVANLTTGRSEVITAGPLAEFILASGALPGFFAAREIAGSLYWDGGVANALPFDHWLSDPGIDTIIVHRVTNAGRTPPHARALRMSSAVKLSHDIICEELLRLKIDLAARAGKRLIFMRTVAARPSLWDPAKLGAGCIETGRATASQNRATLAELAA